MYYSMSYYSEKLEQISKDKLQLEAYNTQDSTVVVAGPGSGKTTILTLKIMRLLSENVKEPRGLACLTYSREAAREFEDRLKMLGYKERRNVFLGTVHSFCISEILGNFAGLYDYRIPLPIKIISDKEKKRIFEEVKKDLGLNDKYIKTSDMDKERTLSISGMSDVQVKSDEIILKVAEEYEKRITSAGYVDYESIIIYSTKLLQEQEYIRKCLNAKFPWIVIDEYQDLGKPLHEMILSLFIHTDIKIFAVGDPDQSIYSFSGAVPDYLMELYNRKDTIGIKLKNNYRSNQDIVDGSELVLDIKRGYQAATRENESADFYFVWLENDLEDQYKCCVNRIIPYYVKNGVPLEEIAILVKYNQDARDLSIHCMDKDIPYYISKHDFDRTDFVKWLENCAAWVYDKTSISFDEIYIFWEKLVLLHRDDKFISENDRLNMKKWLYKVLFSTNINKDSLCEWLNMVLDNLEINKMLINSEVYPDELDNIDKLLAETADEQYKDYDISKFTKIGKPENQVILSTRHSSKGLEFEVVIMLGMEDGNFPDYRKVDNPDELAEENRICFVCVSRAKRVCILLTSKSYEIPNGVGGTWTKQCKPSIYFKQLYQKYRK